MELKGLTLKQALNKIPSTTPINVGCGWFYCYYNDTKAQDKINKESLAILESLKRRLKSKQSEFKDMDKKLKRNIARIKSSKTLNAKQKKNKISITQKAYQEKVISLPKTIANYEKRIANYKTMLDRKVIESYQLNMPVYENPNNIYLVVSGKEAGHYDDIGQYATVLIICDEDKRMSKVLNHRKRDIANNQKIEREMVKIKKGTKYKVVYENGVALGLKEVKR